MRPLADQLLILDPMGFFHLYAHLNTFATDLYPGSIVNKGDFIGTLGKTGGSGNWSHLHYGMYAEQPSGRIVGVDPYPFIVQSYLDENKSSCGCDKDLHVDISQPVVRFNQFNDSALDFSMWLYVKDYGSQFKTKTDLRMIMYEEFKKYDIRIPWPIRTVYQGDEKKEQIEIDEKDEFRNKVIDEA